MFRAIAAIAVGTCIAALAFASTPSTQPARFVDEDGSASERLIASNVAVGARYVQIDSRSEKVPMAIVLVPNRGGVTSAAQPTLYWLLTDDTSLDVELTVQGPGAIEPEYETVLVGFKRAGLHAFSLKNAGVKLKENAVYKFSVVVRVADEVGRICKAPVVHRADGEWWMDRFQRSLGGPASTTVTAEALQLLKRARVLYFPPRGGNAAALKYATEVEAELLAQLEKMIATSARPK